MKFKITQKAGSAKVIWDAENDKPLLEFKGGLFETDSESVASKAKDLGFDVLGETKAARTKKKSGTGE